MLVRHRYLDGIRGVAAAVVLVHHALLSIPATAAGYFPQFGAVDGWARIATYTPLHLLWAGREAVFLFFVLSGIVLTMPFANGRAMIWASYYPQRLARLYIPVFGAIALAGLTYLLAPRHADAANLGPWIDAHPVTYPLKVMLADSVLLTGPSASVSPLWSLRWEVAFSLLLPAYFCAAPVMRRRPVLSAAGMLAMILAGSILHKDSLLFMPMFGLGVVMALRWPAIAAWTAQAPPCAWPPILALSGALTCLSWLLAGLGLEMRGVEVLTVAGVALLIITGSQWIPLRRLLERHPAQWLGRISFSLYLVHEPLLIGARFLFPNALVAVPLAVALSLAVAAAFWRLVEKPSLSLSKAAGRFAAVAA